jgi:hypothetical protein
MPPRSSISESFLLLDGARTVEQARRLIGVATPRYLVVEVEGARHVLAARDFEARVEAAAPSGSLRESGLLAGSAAAAVRTLAEAPTCDPEAPVLVEDRGVLVGVLARRQGGRPGLLLLDRPRWAGDPGADPADASARYVSAMLPESVFAGEGVLLAVQLGSRESPLPVAVPDGATVTVVVHACDGLAVEGAGTASLRVPEDGTAARAEFWLRAGPPGAGTVRVFAFHDGGLLGTLDLHPAILPRPGVPARDLPPRHLVQVAALDAAATPGADLMLLIFEEKAAGKPVLRIRVAARDPSLKLNFREFGPVALRLPPMEYFHAFFADIKAVEEHSDPEVARRKLEMRGALLFENLFPEPLQALLWELRERVTSLEIHSEEAWIPWELCRLTGRENENVRSGPFFCEAFEITRWIPGIARQPRLTLNHLAVVAPGASGLSSVADEVGFLRSQEADGRRVREVPARYMDVWEALASGEFDGFHFCGHGFAARRDAGRAAIALEEGERLRAEEICGELRNLGRSQPLIFLNACHGARGGASLVDTGGWARGFLRTGAGAFVGAYWTVDDRSAADFARAFYREVRAGRTLGAAVRAARLEIRSDDDATWLAYTVYCDPHAAIRE